MRNVPSGLADKFARGDVTLAVFWKLIRNDGAVFGFTDHDRPLTFDVDGTGDVEYLPNLSFNRSAIATGDTMAVDETQVDATIDTQIFTEEALEAGLFDRAEVLVFAVDWTDPALGNIKFTKGWLGQVERMDHRFKTELRGLTQVLQKYIISLCSPLCRSDFGDTGSGPDRGCNFPLAPVAWSALTSKYADGAIFSSSNTRTKIADYVVPTVENGWMYECTVSGVTGSSEPAFPTTAGSTVTDGSATWRARRSVRRTAEVASVTNHSTFGVTGLLGDLTVGTGGNKSAGFFVEGTARFSNGRNSGLARELVGFDYVSGSGASAVYRATTLIPFPFDVAVGDDLVMTAGCDKTLGVCRDNWNNLKNGRMEPYVPGREDVFSVVRPMS